MNLKEWIMKLDNYLYENEFTLDKYLDKYISEEEFKKNNLTRDDEIYCKLIHVFFMSKKGEKLKHYHRLYTDFRIEFIKPQNEQEKQFLDIYVSLKKAINEINLELNEKYEYEFNNYLLTL